MGEARCAHGPRGRPLDHPEAQGHGGPHLHGGHAHLAAALGEVPVGHSGDSEDLGYLRGLMERGSAAGVTDDQIDQMLVPNPRAILEERA